MKWNSLNHQHYLVNKKSRDARDQSDEGLMPRRQELDSYWLKEATQSVMWKYLISWNKGHKLKYGLYSKQFLMWGYIMRELYLSRSTAQGLVGIYRWLPKWSEG